MCVRQTTGAYSVPGGEETRRDDGGQLAGLTSSASGCFFAARCLFASLCPRPASIRRGVIPCLSGHGQFGQCGERVCVCREALP